MGLNLYIQIKNKKNKEKILRWVKKMVLALKLARKTFTKLLKFPKRG
jgi:hypothetical protein